MFLWFRAVLFLFLFFMNFYERILWTRYWSTFLDWPWKPLCPFDHFPFCFPESIPLNSFPKHMLPCFNFFLYNCIVLQYFTKPLDIFYSTFFTCLFLCIHVHCWHLKATLSITLHPFHPLSSHQPPLHHSGLPVLFIQPLFPSLCPTSSSCARASACSSLNSEIIEVSWLSPQLA